MLGTFALAYAVRASIVGVLPILPTPLVAGLTLGLFVNTIGSLTGCHINPAITIGLLSVRKIKLNDAVLYLVAQFLGAAVALVLASMLMTTAPTVDVPQITSLIIFGEAFGAFFFAFGVASVVHGKTPAPVAGPVIGLSLFFGILLAAFFSGGILNPAVAISLMPGNLALYLFAPLVGSVAAFWAYGFLFGELKRQSKRK